MCAQKGFLFSSIRGAAPVALNRDVVVAVVVAAATGA
jgi:hypothetical protein